MSYAEFLRRTVAVIIIAITILLVGSAIFQLASLLMLIFACWVFSVGLTAAVQRLHRRGMRRSVAVFVTLGSTLLVLGGVLAIILPVFIQQIANLVEQLPDTIDSLVESYEDLREDNDFLGSILPEYTLDELGDPDLEETSAPPINVNTILASIVPVLGGIGSFFGSVLANLFLLVTITLYLFANPKIYYRAIIAMVPRHREAFALGIINRIEYAIVAWMRSLVISIFFVGIMTTLVLGVIFQIPNAVAMGVIAGLSGLIPNLGYYIGLIPIVLFTAIHDPVLIIPAVIVYALINEFDGKVIQPRVVQEALAIPAGVVLPFQIISASLFGFFGILLAVPILAIIIILVRRVYVGELLGKQDTITDVEEGADGQYTLVESTADTR